MIKKIKKEDNVELCWTGKQEMLASLDNETDKVMIECKEESKNFNTTNNMYIEGDNLEVLKLLQKDYNSKIKMIYIDPPYNTKVKRNYKDSWTHSEWLNMMYPRLLLARQLLTEDGVIFISIDDHEQANLSKLLKDVFGDDNVDVLIWRKNGKQGNTKKITRFKTSHEYLMVAYKNKSITTVGKVKLLPNWKGEKVNADNDPRGNWESGIISRHEEKSNTSSDNYYSITLPSGRIMTREFFVSKEEFENYVSENKIFFPKDGDGVPRLKIFENEEQKYFFNSIIDEMGTLSSAKEEIAEIFGDRDLFDTPKPTKIIKELIRTLSAKDSIILDFFSGSATTAHAVMQLNAEDGGNRRFIMVQLPEICDEKTEAFKQGYKNICEIGKERIRRAGEKIVANIDKGFKVYKLIEKE